jgi:short-subunit dehydrogenase
MLAALGVAAVAAWRAVQWARRTDLRGKVVVITGGSRGLGLALARELTGKGARVAICARTAEDLVWAKQDIDQRGGHHAVLALPCDVSDATSVARFVAEVRLKVGPIDVVINNAGIIAVGPIEAMTRADFERVMAVNFWGAVNMTMAVLASMRERRSGHIVNISSIGAKVAVPHLLAYDCAKFAVQGFSEGLQAEVAKDGVCVTTIVPGLMRTGSALHATFKGDAHKEVVWFAAGDAMRWTAMDAGRAARRIVRAIERRESQVTLTWQAKLLRLAHALAPSLVVDGLALANRLLPPADGHGHAGAEGRTVMKPELRAALAKDAKSYNQAN